MALESIGEVIHNGKKFDQKDSTTDQMASVQLYISTEAEGSTTDSEVNSTYATDGRRSQDSKSKRVQARKDVEIDSYLFGLVNEGLVNMPFLTWHAKVIYTIGMERYHMYVLQLRSSIEMGKTGAGKRIQSPPSLLAYKLKGAMELHYKRKFMDE